MNPAWTSLAIALALTLVPGTATAQDDDVSREEATGTTTGPRGKSAPRAQAPVSVPLDGVPAEAVTGLLSDLRALTQAVYACPTCNDESRRPGTCTQCSAELTESRTSPVVARVEIAVDRRFLSITLNPHLWLSVKDLDTVLAKAGGKVRRDDFKLPQHARLSVSAAAGANAGRVRAALVDLKIVPAVTVVPDPDSESVWVMPRSGKESVTVGAIEAGLARMSGEYRLLDVEWATLCPTCGTRPTIEMGDPTCRAK